MSKKKVKDDEFSITLVPEPQNWAIGNFQIKNLEGRLLTIIEAIGLRPTQEESVKSMLRRELWTIKEAAIPIDDEDLSMLINKHADMSDGTHFTTSR